MSLATRVVLIVSILLPAAGCQSRTPHTEVQTVSQAPAVVNDRPEDGRPPGPLIDVSGFQTLVGGDAPTVGDVDLPSPTRLSAEKVLSIAMTSRGLVAIVARGKTDKLLLIEPDGSSQDLGALEGARATILELEGAIVIGARGGLFRHTVDNGLETLATGVVTAALLDGDGVVFAECEWEAQCALRRLDQEGIKDASAVRPDFVRDLAVWGGRLIVAGREHPPGKRGGKRQVHAAEVREIVKWIEDGGPAPSALPYPPGFLLEIDRASDSLRRFDFPRHRPSGVATVSNTAAELFVLTEGTPEQKFEDGVLVKIDRNGEWTLLARDLGNPDWLYASDRRVCWEGSFTTHRQVACYDRPHGASLRMATDSLHSMRFFDRGEDLLHGSLRGGLFAQPFP